MSGFDVKGVNSSQQSNNTAPLHPTLEQGLKELVQNNTLSKAEASRLANALQKVPFSYSLSDSVSFSQSMEQFWKLKEAPALQNIPKLSEALNQLAHNLIQTRKGDLTYDAYSLQSSPSERIKAQSQLMLEDMRRQNALRSIGDLKDLQRPKPSAIEKAPPQSPEKALPKADDRSQPVVKSAHFAPADLVKFASPAKAGTAAATVNLFDD